jgi:stage V sporulation protein G
MQVTEVKVFPVEEDKLRAYVTITLDNCFAIRDLKVIRGTTGYFVSMPSKKRKDGTYKDVAHPINSETRAMIEEKILEEYERVTNDVGAKSMASSESGANLNAHSRQH